MPKRNISAIEYRVDYEDGSWCLCSGESLHHAVLEHLSLKGTAVEQITVAMVFEAGVPNAHCFYQGCDEYCLPNKRYCHEHNALSERWKQICMTDPRAI